MYFYFSDIYIRIHSHIHRLACVYMTYTNILTGCIEVGVNCGLLGQIVTMAVLASIVSLSDRLSSGFLVLSLLLAWLVTISVNNIVTTYFNSISQE